MDSLNVIFPFDIFILRLTDALHKTFFRIFAEKKRFFCSFVKYNSNRCKIHIHMCKVQKRGKDCADKTAQGAGAHGA